MKKNSGEYWDSRLRQSQDNPFPLAPADLLKKGLVNAANYSTQNMRFGLFCQRKMLAELENLNRDGEIEIFGIGLARDIGWVLKAIEHFGVKMWDHSTVARQNATLVLRPRTWLQMVEIAEGEVMKGWKAGQIDREGVMAIYASQFLEHQGDALKSFAYHFGKFLRVPDRRIYLVLPRLEDNPPDKVKWDSAVPPLDHEWQVPLNEGFGGLTNICKLGTHKYFHRRYTFFRISG